MKKFFGLFLLLVFFSCKSDKKETQSKDYQKVNSEEKIEKSPLESSIERGKKVYANICVACHLPSGKGLPGTYPPLDGSNWLTEKREKSLAAVKFGLSGPIEVNGKLYDNLMTPMGLSDKEIADVMNFVMNSWSNKIEPAVTEEEVAAIKRKDGEKTP